jgi:rod shape-determining protein MreC
MVNRSVVWLVVAGIIVFLALNLPPRLSAPLRDGLTAAFSPVIKFGHGALSGVVAVGKGWSSRRRLAEENERLQKKVRELTLENLSLRGIQGENRRLRKLLDFKESAGRTLLPAQVVGRDTRQWYSSILIDKGTKDGIQPEMAVICEEGVVGKVIEAGPSLSTVLLIIDGRSRVGGIVERTREAGIVEGSSFNTCRLNYLPRRSETRPGDRVLSSGLGGVYPKGLSVGEVTGVNEGEYGLFSYADVLPGVNFARLEEVLVIIERGEKEEDFLR